MKPPQPKQEVQVIKNENKIMKDSTSHLFGKSSDDNCTPIKALTTFSRDWVIKARVASTSGLKSTRNGGHLMKLELVDMMNTHIEATFWGDAAKNFFP